MKLEECSNEQLIRLVKALYRRIPNDDPNASDGMFLKSPEFDFPSLMLADNVLQNGPADLRVEFPINSLAIVLYRQAEKEACKK